MLNVTFRRVVPGRLRSVQRIKPSLTVNLVELMDLPVLMVYAHPCRVSPFSPTQPDEAHLTL